MNIEYLKEKIAVYKTLIALFWTGLFILGGGLVHYYSNIKTVFQKIIFMSGLLFEISLFFVVIIVLYEIKRLLKKLKDS